MRYCQIQHNFKETEYLCKLAKNIKTHRQARLILFSRQHLQTFDISHAFLPFNAAKLSSIKNGPVFLAHPVEITLLSHCQPRLHAGIPCI